jgi:hypothetical protein
MFQMHLRLCLHFFLGSIFIIHKEQSSIGHTNITVVTSRPAPRNHADSMSWSCACWLFGAIDIHSNITLCTLPQSGHWCLIQVIICKLLLIMLFVQMFAVTLLHTLRPTFGCRSNTNYELTWPLMTADNINGMSNSVFRRGLNENFVLLGCYAA